MSSILDEFFPEHDNDPSNYKLIRPVSGSNIILHIICYKPEKTRTAYVGEEFERWQEMIRFLLANGAEVDDEC